MLQWFSKKIHNRKGFTLIELVVVIAILGILAAIAVPKYTTSRENAKLNAHLANIRVIESAITLYDADHGTTGGSTTANLTGTYVATWPTKPGTYAVAAGVLTASPTKAATETALGGGTAVTWP